MGALEAIHYVKGTVFILQHLLQVSITVGSVWLIPENLKSTVFIWGNLLWPFSYNSELVAVIFVSSHPILSWSLHKNEIFH